MQYFMLRPPTLGGLTLRHTWLRLKHSQGVAGWGQPRRDPALHARAAPLGRLRTGGARPYYQRIGRR